MRRLGSLLPSRSWMRVFCKSVVKNTLIQRRLIRFAHKAVHPSPSQEKGEIVVRVSPIEPQRFRRRWQGPMTAIAYSPKRF